MEKIVFLQTNQFNCLSSYINQNKRNASYNKVNYLELIWVKEKKSYKTLIKFTVYKDLSKFPNSRSNIHQSYYVVYNIDTCGHSSFSNMHALFIVAPCFKFMHNALLWSIVTAASLIHTFRANLQVSHQNMDDNMNDMDENWKPLANWVSESEWELRGS